MYDLKRDTEITAASLGFGGSATSTADGPIKAETTYTAYKDTVKNFGTVFAANLEAFNNLMEANQHLGTNVAASVTDIQTQIQNLTHPMHNMAAASARPQPPQYHQPP